MQTNFEKKRLILNNRRLNSIKYSRRRIEVEFKTAAIEYDSIKIDSQKSWEIWGIKVRASLGVVSWVNLLGEIIASFIADLHLNLSRNVVKIIRTHQQDRLAMNIVRQACMEPMT